MLANTKQLLAKASTIVGASGIHADQYPELDLLAKENQVPAGSSQTFRYVRSR